MNSKIVKITKLKNRNDRYDLTVNSTHNFYANGILIHNTSGRIGKTFILSRLNKFQEFINRIYPIFKEKLVVDYLVGTRRVTLGISQGIGSYYGNEEFRYKHLEKIKDNLEIGEILMGELVGYTTSGQLIMDSHETKDTQDKEYIKKYGKKIVYSYGLPEKECEFYVYRILKIDAEGKSVDLSWKQVKKRCQELNLKHVVDIVEPFIFDGDYDKLKEFVESNNAGPDLIDERIHREGLVLRMENENKTPLFIKSKNWYFGIQEGYLKNSDNYVDTEEMQNS